MINNAIDQSISAFLYVQHPRVPLFYILPKIHKSLENPVGRPMVSGIGSVTEKNSQYVDYYLKPLVTTLPSFLKITGDFLRLLDKTVIPEQCLLVSFVSIIKFNH